jgi:carbamoylphosphate synthase large subunit
MEREEIDAMWQRIKSLEENSLKVSKALAKQSMYSIVGIMSQRSAAAGKHTTFAAYMQPKGQKALEQIENAQNVEEVIQLMREFTADCLDFTLALLK